MYSVYVLKSEKNGRLYYGCTNSLKRRLAEHNSGYSKYTKNLRPLKLVYSEMCDSLTEARKREKFFKSGRGREIIKLKLASAVA